MGPLLVQPFVQWGQCVAFTGDSSLDSDDRTMGKEEQKQPSVCQEGVLVVAPLELMGAGDDLFLRGPRSQVTQWIELCN
jgi:hypothetical protein